MTEDIEELFIHDKEMPNVCAKCPCYNEEYYCCDVNGVCPDNSYDEKLKICPLKSIEEHDKELARQVLNKVLEWCRGNKECVTTIGGLGVEYGDVIYYSEIAKMIQKYLEELE